MPAAARLGVGVGVGIGHKLAHHVSRVLTLETPCAAASQKRQQCRAPGRFFVPKVYRASTCVTNITSGVLGLWESCGATGIQFGLTARARSVLMLRPATLAKTTLVSLAPTRHQSLLLAFADQIKCGETHKKYGTPRGMEYPGPHTMAPKYNGDLRSRSILMNDELSACGSGAIVGSFHPSPIWLQTQSQHRDQ